MAKKKQEKPRREVTRRQLSRLQRQKRRQRIIFGLAVLIVVAVLSVVGVGVYQGWYVKDFKPLHEVVLEVNGTEFNMEYYINMLALYTSDMSSEFISYMSSYVVDIIIRDELVRQETEALGVVLTDEELDEFIGAMESPPQEKYRDAIAAQLLLQKVRDDYFGSQIPQSAEQRHILAMFLESEAQVNEVSARIEAGEDFGELAAELSLDETTKEAAGDLGWCPLGVLPLKVDSAVLEEAAFNAEVGVLSPPIFEEDKSKPVAYWLIEVINVDDTVSPAQATVRRILVGSEQEALDIRARLEAGEDFDELAIAYSLDSLSNVEGGALTLVPGDSTTAFDDYVFDPEVELGVFSQPVRDSQGESMGGYWLIEITGLHPNREIDEETRLLLAEEALDNWIEELMNNPDNVIVNNLDEEKVQWAVDYIVTGGEA